MASVLIVDDEASIRVTLAEFLREDGHEVSVAATAQDALRVLAQRAFDVVVSDIIMPRMSGIELLEALQRAAPRSKVILITGEPTYETASAAVRLNAFDYLAKPVRGAAICKAVRAAAHVKALEDENREYRARLEALVDERTARLRESESRYRRMTECSMTGICVQRGGDLLFANPRLAEILGCVGETPTTAVARPLSEFVHADDRRAFDAHLHGVLRDGDATRACIARVHRRDGTIAWIEVLPVVIDHEGEPAVMVTVMDVTSRVEAERRESELRARLAQAQKLEAIGRLAGGVAHDFNNMLTVIRGATELAWSTLPEDHEVRGDLDEIRKAAERATHLTNQLLAFSRKQAAEPEVIRVDEALARAGRMLARLIGEHVELVFQVDPDVWPVFIDPTQLDQVLANLVTNARDAMTDGGRITVAARNASRDRLPASVAAELGGPDCVVLTVTDTGPGIDEAIREKIFEPFFTTKEAGRGTGLGLATVYGIVQQHQGTVHVDVGEQGGTIFSVFLPRSHASSRPRPEMQPEAAPVSGGATILLVEDEAPVRVLVQRILEQRGFTVLSASEPAEALRLLPSLAGKLDLLLSDVVMPGMNGPALFEKVRGMVPGLRVLFMTGYSDGAIGSLSSGGSIAPLIRKPFTPTELMDRIREVLPSRCLDAPNLRIP